MKKTILYSLLALTISTSVLTSCEDAFGSFLDKQPSNELTEEQVFGDWSLMEQFHFDFFINIINFDRDNIRYFPCIVIIEYYVEILFFKFLYHTILNTRIIFLITL